MEKIKGLLVKPYELPEEIEIDNTLWDNEQEKYFISVVDIVRILTDSDNPQVYWRVMKKN